MAIIERSRNLSPSTRKPDSPYKIDTRDVTSNDKLKVNIFSNNTLLRTFTFAGKDIDGRQSIHFKYDNNRIIWSPKFLNNYVM